MTQLHTALFGCTLLEDLKAQGDEHLAAHLHELHRCRNSFVHGDPEAIGDELVKRTVELLQDVQEAYVRLYNRRCTHLPRITPIWDERPRP